MISGPNLLQWTMAITLVTIFAAIPLLLTVALIMVWMKEEFREFFKEGK